MMPVYAMDYVNTAIVRRSYFKTTVFFGLLAKFSGLARST